MIDYFEIKVVQLERNIANDYKEEYKLTMQNRKKRIN